MRSALPQRELRPPLGTGVYMEAGQSLENRGVQSPGLRPSLVSWRGPSTPLEDGEHEAGLDPEGEGLGRAKLLVGVS